MADRNPTRFNRLQAGENLNTPAAGHVEAFGETMLSQQVTLTAANTAGNPASLMIAGIFQTVGVNVSHTDALTTTSALTILIGVSGATNAFRTHVVSAGAGNEINVQDSPGSALVPNWVSYGSAAAKTEVLVSHSAASVAAALSAQVTFNYIVRG